METFVELTPPAKDAQLGFFWKGLAPYRKARKNTRWNCPIWVQLGGYDCLLM